ncbi:Clp protease N-terminal domain-containing protein, partial [Micromonospora sediminimaris]|uniref:Clp protease N-terminal domain-containing protein n=1 Tax=Micromonospora sediminimaris TaxID=547162 RepID=UPI00379B0575
MLCPQRTDDHAVAASRPPRLTSKISNGGCRTKRSWQTERNNPPWTAAAARIAEGARELANLGARMPAGSAHLVYAAVTDSDDTGRELLADLGVDARAVRDLAAARLGLN